ncbi:MAG: outer membrane lipoprotein carrier protein LolA, partial [Desulfuromonadales bacterium]|nr:outer membrane lipoprotein carrier protein LolA [Desulfuromonadales bacterium]NIS42537.1 outer membrane lipoprotein carrier protein LolA [Desulfuromonadales bacterium]
FTQESSIASLDRTQQGGGRVTLRFEQQGGGQVPLVKFRWEYEHPTRQEIVSDGRTMWVYIPENNQVIESDISEVSRARAQDPLTFLT